MDLLNPTLALTASPELAPAPSARTAPALEVVWARHLDEVQAAQRLRFAVFATEMGADLSASPDAAQGLDIDAFDNHCEHLLVRTAPDAGRAAQVVGTYRVLLPQAACRAGSYYSESEFDLGPLAALRPHMAELGRSCIHPDWREGAVIMMLWSHVVKFLAQNGVRHAVGCASMPIRDGGYHAARVWRQLEASHLTEPHLRVQPHAPLPLDHLQSQGAVEVPPLIRGYLKCGARVMGPPAWDPEFGVADLPMWLDLDALPASYRRRFLGA